MPKEKLFSEKEKRILKRHITRTAVREKDKDFLNDLAGIGFISFRFDWDVMEETARLTPSGLKHFNR